MANKVEDLVNVILDSYNECDITARIDEENMLNKDILMELFRKKKQLQLKCQCSHLKKSKVQKFL